MVIDHIDNIKKYKKEDNLQKALKSLSLINLDNYKKKLQEYNGEMNFIEFTSKEEEKCLFETHKRFVDIHYILEGSEKIQWQKEQFLENVEPYNNQTDIAFWEGDMSVEFILQPGFFIVCYPDDAHKVGMRVNFHEETVKKIVVKLPVNT